MTSKKKMWASDICETERRHEELDRQLWQIEVEQAGWVLSLCFVLMVIVGMVVVAVAL